MRISDYFNLGRNQAELDFVNVDVEIDNPVFIDPRALRTLHTDWGQECVSLVQAFFESVLEAIRDKRDDDAKDLLLGLREPNETHLGFSVGKSRGHALGPNSVNELWLALSRSRAVKSGLITDLEDTALMIPGIDRDIISDITTNIIKRPLIEYTRKMCEYYDIPTEEVGSGPLWDPATGEWGAMLVKLPVTNCQRLLLVPKSIARIRLDFNSQEYFNHYLLTHLDGVERAAGSELVRLLKNKKKRVYKKDLKRKYGTGKRAVEDLTLKYPQVLEDYKHAKSAKISKPLSNERISEILDSPPPDWNGLLKRVVDQPSGREHANSYHSAIERLLSALFYPELVFPTKEQEIHNGRKRIDITYVNNANGGFFSWLHKHYPSGLIFVECKNYSVDPANPELDQLSGRFSRSRGQVGILVCRPIQDKELLLQRCRDTAKDDRGYIIPIDDTDLGILVGARKLDKFDDVFRILYERFQILIS